MNTQLLFPSLFRVKLSMQLTGPEQEEKSKPYICDIVLWSEQESAGRGTAE